MVEISIGELSILMGFMMLFGLSATPQYEKLFYYISTMLIFYPIIIEGISRATNYIKERSSLK